MGKVVALRKGRDVSVAAAKRGAAMQRIGALLRRSHMFNPIAKWNVGVYFDTEGEASEFQRLVHSIRRRRP